MLQYALLHLFGFGLTIDDLKAFRVSLVLSHCHGILAGV
jgi:transketolase